MADPGQPPYPGRSASVPRATGAQAQSGFGLSRGQRAAQPAATITRAAITAGVLAGGAGTRLGGIDKGWFAVAGQPLIAHTLGRLEGQCGQVIISANRSVAAYRRYGWPVVTDADGAGSGPLAGVAALLASVTTPYLLLVPVDTPALPRDLGARLGRALGPDTDLARAAVDCRVQPLHALLRASLAPGLAQARAGGVHAARDWQARLACVDVRWPDKAEFANINCLQDAAAFGAVDDP